MANVGLTDGFNAKVPLALSPLPPIWYFFNAATAAGAASPATERPPQPEALL